MIDFVGDCCGHDFIRSFGDYSIKYRSRIKFKKGKINSNEYTCLKCGIISYAIKTYYNPYVLIKPYMSCN